MLPGLLALLLGAFSGSGLVPIFTKIGLRFSSPLIFVFLRFFLATMLFLPIFIFTKKKQLVKKDYLNFLILALLLFVNVTFFTVGVEFTTVLMSQLLYVPTPIVVSIFAHFFLHERITKQKLIGLVIALFGVCFLLYQSVASAQKITFGTPLGNGIILIAMLGYSGWVLYSRSLSKTQRYTSYQVSFFTFLFIALYLLILLPFQQKLVPSHITGVLPTGILFAIFVGITSVVQYFFLQLGIKKTSAFTASLFQYVGPFFAGMISIPVLHEKPSFLFVIGGAFIIAGVFYATTFNSIKKYLQR